jgi:GntR family transcriptional regulator of vanillate catabolism
VKEDELSYGRMNKRFHDTMIEGAQNGLLADLVRRVYAIPFVAPGVIAFNKVASEEVFPILVSGHHQHHAVVDAIDARQPDVAEILMRGHSSPARRSLGLTRSDPTG